MTPANFNLPDGVSVDDIWPQPERDESLYLDTDEPRED